MTLLSRLYGVRLLATHYFPAGAHRPPLVLLRSPYGRGSALDAMPKLLAERGYQVLYQSLRGTAGSGGRFDGFVIDPADADGTLSWLRAQPWFGGVLATWGASYLGLAQWELAARQIPEWKIALIQDAPSAFAEDFMYPGGAFALGNALGWVQLVDTMFRSGFSAPRQFLAAFTAGRKLRRATLTLPVAEADRALTGHPVNWFAEWISNGPDVPGDVRAAPTPATAATPAPANPWPPPKGCTHPTTRSSTTPTTPQPSGCPSPQEHHETARPRRHPPRGTRRRRNRAGPRR